jgi:hypothetical protein
MTFDARSREQLEALGRRLPKPLPAPEPAASRPAPSPRRHRLETENDPQQLFRELIAASPDGTVPPHLMERLRELEQRRPSSSDRSATSPPAGSPTAAAPAAHAQGARRRRRPVAPPLGLSAEEQQQYATFAHLLLELEEDG